MSKKIIGNLKRDRLLYIMLIPFLLWYLLFTVVPIGWLQIAFREYSLFKGMGDFAGLKYFIEFFGGEFFMRTLKNTIIINLYSLAFGFAAPVALALMLNEVKAGWFKKSVQTVTYLPYFISIVVIAGMVTTFLSPTIGIVNIIMSNMGFNKINFLIKPEYFRGIYTVMNVWKDTGFAAVVYIAALSGIDQQLYEACVIDGGGLWRKLFHVTLPGIMPTVIIMLILKIGALLDVGYEAVILLYQPATYETADVISSYVYRTGIEQGSYSISAAAGIFNSVVALVLVTGANRLSGKVTQTGLW
jgi:putative aldouronate transport system permease protein